MTTIKPEVLEKIIHDSLDDFYSRRLNALNGLQLRKVLKRKNPYLYRATGYESAAEIVQEILKAHLTSSDEGIFGDAFFERVALEASGGQKSLTDSVDMEIHTESSIKAYAVKSGTSVFNGQSKPRQQQAFNACMKRVSKMRKHFEAIVGYGYGNKKFKGGKYSFREVAGQDFWQEITGDPDFYLKLIRLMGDKPKNHLPAFTAEFNKALNRFVRDFVQEFCFSDGKIDWEKLVEFNSGSSPKKSRRKNSKSSPDESEYLFEKS
jgi:hypothetical protein